MKKKMPFYNATKALFVFALMANLYVKVRAEMLENQPEIVIKIREFAHKIDVFPLAIIAENRKTREMPWDQRFELTFDRYRTFFEFKEFSCSLTNDELVDLLQSFETSSSKEKSLILSAFYIHDYSHRPPQRSGTPKGQQVSKLIPRFGNASRMDRTLWEQWETLLEQCVQDKSIAFPAIDRNVSELEQEWKTDQKATVLLLQQTILADRNIEKNQRTLDGLNAFDDGHLFHGPRWCGWFLNDLSKNMLSEHFKPYQVFCEFFLLQYEETFGMGTIPNRGNSSSQPKALGEIATQLLMSRLPYEEEK